MHFRPYVSFLMLHTTYEYSCVHLLHPQCIHLRLHILYLLIYKYKLKSFIVEGWNHFPTCTRAVYMWTWILFFSLFKDKYRTCGPAHLSNVWYWDSHAGVYLHMCMHKGPMIPIWPTFMLMKGGRKCVQTSGYLCVAGLLLTKVYRHVLRNKK